MAESRELGYAENYMHLLQAMICGNGQIVCAIQLEGPMTPKLFIKALHYLYEHQPLMQAKILKAERYYFELSTSFDEVPVKILQREDDRHWERIVDSELRKIIPAEKYLWSMTLLYEGSGASHEVILTMNPAAGDGISIIRLFCDLLQIVSALSKNTPIDLPAHRLMPPVELLLQSPLSWDEFLANKTASQVQSELLTTWRYDSCAPYDRRQTKAIYRKIDADTVTSSPIPDGMGLPASSMQLATGVLLK